MELSILKKSVFHSASHYLHYLLTINLALRFVVDIYKKIKSDMLLKINYSETKKTRTHKNVCMIVRANLTFEHLICFLYNTVDFFQFL